MREQNGDWHLDLADVIRLNQLVRGRIDFDGFGRWFDSLSPAQRVALADTVFGYAHQAGLTDPVFDEAVRAAGLPTDHPVVRRLWDARRGRDFEYLFHPDRFLTPLDEADRRTACRFFVALFGTAEGRRLCRPEWADSCNHWWHRDLLDRRVVDDLLNNPQYASTSMRDDARLFPCLTEHEWLSGTDPWRMFEFVRGKAGDRKLRLLACAWVGRLGGDSSVVSWGEVREAAYRLADGCDGRRDAPDFDREALWAARSLKEEWGRRVCGMTNYDDGGYCLSGVGLGLLDHPFGQRRVVEVAAVCRRYLSNRAEWDRQRGFEHARKFEALWLEALAGMLRDIFGNPFRPAAIDATWLTPTATRIAEQMYNLGDFSAAPILADALEESGCTSADILDHLRGRGPHVRGCWPVDLVLGRE